MATTEQLQKELKDYVNTYKDHFDGSVMDKCLKNISAKLEEDKTQAYNNASKIHNKQQQLKEDVIIVLSSIGKGEFEPEESIKLFATAWPYISSLNITLKNVKWCNLLEQKEIYIWLHKNQPEALKRIERAVDGTMAWNSETFKQLTWHNGKWIDIENGMLEKEKKIYEEEGITPLAKPKLKPKPVKSTTEDDYDRVMNSLFGD